MSATLPKGWSRVELGELATFVSGGTPDKARRDFWNGDIPWVSAKDLKRFHVEASEDRITSAGLREIRPIPPDSVIMLVRGMGLFKDAPIGLTRRTIGINQDLKALIPNSSVDPEYLGRILQAKRTILMGAVDRAGHGTGRLSTDYLQTLPIEFPALDEQRRITAALVAWDRAIETAEALVAAKQRQRTAFVRLRILGSQSYGRPDAVGSLTERLLSGANSWPMRCIGDFATESSDTNGRGANHPVLSCTKHGGLVFSAEYFGGRRIHSEDTSGYKVVKHGEFAYATNHLEEGSIGLQKLAPAGLVSPMYTVFRVDANQALAEFVFIALKTEAYRQIFEINTSSSVDRRGGLRWAEFAALPFALPSLAEQQQIVAAVGALDTNLEREVERLNAIRRQKRGIMQKLLTGEWRLAGSVKEKAA